MERRLRVMAEIIQAAGQGYVPCLFHTFTGLYCPGCGGTRAVSALLHGHVLQSFYYHPLVPYAAFAVPAFLLYVIYLKKRNRSCSPVVWKTLLFFGLGILIVNFIVKNYLLLVCGLALL